MSGTCTLWIERDYMLYGNKMLCGCKFTLLCLIPLLPGLFWIRRTGHLIIRNLVTFLVTPPPTGLSASLCVPYFSLCEGVHDLSALPPHPQPLPWFMVLLRALRITVVLVGVTNTLSTQRPISPLAEEWEGHQGLWVSGRFGLESRLRDATLRKLLNISEPHFTYVEWGW